MVDFIKPPCILTNRLSYCIVVRRIILVRITFVQLGWLFSQIDLLPSHNLPILLYVMAHCKLLEVGWLALLKHLEHLLLLRRQPLPRLALHSHDLVYV